MAKLKPMQSDTYGSEIGKETEIGKLRRVVIEPAANGFIVSCDYEPSKNSAKDVCCVEPEKKVAKNIEELYTILSKKLS